MKRQYLESSIRVAGNTYYRGFRLGDVYQPLPGATAVFSGILLPRRPKEALFFGKKAYFRVILYVQLAERRIPGYGKEWERGLI